MWSLLYTRAARKTLSKLDADNRRRILKKLEALAEDPFNAQLDVKRLAGTDGFRLRVGDWRVIYDRNEDELVVLVIKLGGRGDIYK